MPKKDMLKTNDRIWAVMQTEILQGSSGQGQNWKGVYSVIQENIRYYENISDEISKGADEAEVIENLRTARRS